MLVGTNVPKNCPQPVMEYIYITTTVV